MHKTRFVKISFYSTSKMLENTANLSHTKDVSTLHWNVSLIFLIKKKKKKKICMVCLYFVCVCHIILFSIEMLSNCTSQPLIELLIIAHFIYFGPLWGMDGRSYNRKYLIFTGFIVLFTTILFIA